MGSNPFEVAVPNVLQALLLGGQSYDAAQKSQQEQAKLAAGQQAAQQYQSGNTKGALATLFGAGNYDGANAIGTADNRDFTQRHTGIEDARNASNDAFSHGIQTKQLAISQQNANRLDDKTPAGFQKNTDGSYTPIKGGPADLEYIRAKEAATPPKPVPFETLSGTRFMVPKGDGTYTVVDPSASGNGAQAAPMPAAASSPQSAPQVAPQTGGAAQPPVQTAQPQTSASGQITNGAQQPPTAAAPQSNQDLTAVDPKTGRREAWLQAQSPDVQAYIKKIADYEIDPRTTSIKGGHREQVMSAVAQYDPTYDQNSFGSRAKAIKDFATGTQGNAIRSFDVATDHLDTLQKYADALKNGDIRTVNMLRQKWQTETGSPLPTNVQAVAPIVGAEVSKAIIGSNNALADREELRKPLNGAGSPEQLSGAIQGYKALMAGQLRGLKKQYEDTTGKKNFLDRLRDNTKQVLGQGEEASTGQPNVTSSGVQWSIH